MRDFVLGGKLIIECWIIRYVCGKVKIDAVWFYLDIVYVKYIIRVWGEIERERERLGR